MAWRQFGPWKPLKGEMDLDSGEVHGSLEVPLILQRLGMSKHAFFLLFFFQSMLYVINVIC